jgi:hypothetical protein
VPPGPLDMLMPPGPPMDIVLVVLGFGVVRAVLVGD